MMMIVKEYVLMTGHFKQGIVTPVIVIKRAVSQVEMKEFVPVVNAELWRGNMKKGQMSFQTIIIIILVILSILLVLMMANKTGFVSDKGLDMAKDWVNTIGG